MSKDNDPTSPDSSVKGDKKKKSIIPKIFSSKKSSLGTSHFDNNIGSSDCNGISPGLETKIYYGRKTFLEDSPEMRKNFSEREASRDIQGLNLSNFDHSMAPATEIKEFRMFVATWNVGGKTPSDSLNLEDFLQVDGCADIYVCGFQEIVPLSAGNVLVSEDNEPAAKWLILINQALNKPRRRETSVFSDSNTNGKDPKHGENNIFHKPSLKVVTKNLKQDGSLLKICNCPIEYSPEMEKRRERKISDSPRNSGPLPFQNRHVSGELCRRSAAAPSSVKYSLVACKQMVGIFLSVWAKKESVPHIGHLRISTVGRGIMGYLGNKGCISLSMSLHRTSFCFVCSHLASGEKEGDELRRNADVAEILKSSQFTRVCKNPLRRSPEAIIDHDRIIWLGDLNYRLALSYEETRMLMEDNEWDRLLEKDQLNMERRAGRVFSGFQEGKITFAPTYKYSHNSDSYAGETVKSKKKRRTPAWCDRILWCGEGIEQLSYIRGESRFSDHRPVSAVFSVDVEVRSRSNNYNNNNNNNRFKKRYSYQPAKLDFDGCMPQRISFFEF